MPDKPESRRRAFIRTSALAAGALTLPRFSVAQPGPSSNRKIGVAVVGAGGMGGYAVEQAAKERFVAICDVDDQRAWHGLREAPRGATLQGLPGDARRVPKGPRRGP